MSLPLQLHQQQSELHLTGLYYRCDLHIPIALSDALRSVMSGTDGDNVSATRGRRLDVSFNLDAAIACR
jgi:hypothetical protein